MDLYLCKSVQPTPTPHGCPCEVSLDTVIEIEEDRPPHLVLLADYQDHRRQKKNEFGSGFLEHRRLKKRKS